MTKRIDSLPACKITSRIIPSEVIMKISQLVKRTGVIKVISLFFYYRYRKFVREAAGSLLESRDAS
jgi:hypothetical protein